MRDTSLPEEFQVPGLRPLHSMQRVRVGIISDATLLSEAVGKALGVSACSVAAADFGRGPIDDEITLAIVVATTPSAVYELGESARRMWPRARQVASAVPDQEGVLLECFARGMHGVVVAHESVAELAEALAIVHDGGLRIPPPIAHLDRLIRVDAAPRRPLNRPLVRITTREREILDLVAIGKQNKEIARDLGIELQTVKNQIFRLFRKLRVSNRADAARLAPPRNPVPSGGHAETTGTNE